MRTLMTTLTVAVALFIGPAVAQNLQQLEGAGQFCIKGASGPIKCEFQTMAQCEQARPTGSPDQCMSRSTAGTGGRAPAPAPGDQKD